MERYLEGRVALVTGGASGQGRAIALALAARGAHVAIGSYLGRDRPRVAGADTHFPTQAELAAAAGQIAALGVKAVARDLDVRSTASVAALVAETERSLGAVDILACSAGTSAMSEVEGHSEELWHEIIDTNLNGAFRAVRATLPGMKKRGWGRIVIIASTAATVGEKSNAAYCASKSGLLGLMRCVALEGAPHGVTCNAISPGYVRTRMLEASLATERKLTGSSLTMAERLAEIAATYPQKRIIEPDEIGALAAYLCREEAKGITMEDITVAAGSLW
jgi:NAD(P)-dependent dehydrogenase (short-subunit alcohol dehydrogenase family)